MEHDPMLRKGFLDTFAVALAILPPIALFLGAMSSPMALAERGRTRRERLRLQAERERRGHAHAARRSWA
jgi:hypothetical protein